MKLRLVLFSSIIFVFSTFIYAKKIVVTGGAGFIGSHVAEHLLRRGDEVIIIDNLNDSCPLEIKDRNLEIVKQADQDNKLTIYVSDICDKEKMHEIFAKHAPDVLCHLAARAGVRTSIEDPVEYMRSNVIGTTVMFEMAVKYNISHVVFASSSSVYGARDNGLFKETDRVEKQSSPYGMTKRAGELLAQVYNHLYGISFNCLRFFTVYGPRGRIDMAAYIFTDKIARGETITILGDGSAVRDFTYIDDIVQGIVKAIDTPLGYQIFNLGCGKPTVLKDFITMIKNTVGKKANIKYTDMIAGDVPLTSANILKAQKLLGYNPKNLVEYGIRKLWKWYSNEYVL